MRTRSWMLLGFAASLFAMSCSSVDIARFEGAERGPEHARAAMPGGRSATARPAERSEAASVDEFGTYNDDASARMLEEKIAAALAREIEERDERARAHQRALEAARAYGEAYARVYRDGGVPAAGFGRDAPPVPWNTLLFGGLGAVIGHQYGRRDRGLAIGAGYGPLNDVFFWNW